MLVLGTSILLLVIKLAAGVLPGIFGIGGGVSIVPALVRFLDSTPHKAAGTSLGVLLPRLFAPQRVTDAKALACGDCMWNLQYPGLG